MKPDEAKYWRFQYGPASKRKEIHFRVYPHLSLAKVRELTVAARVDIAACLDPCALKREAKAARKREAFETFEAVSRAWLAEKTPHWSESNAKNQARRLEKDVLPEIGAASMKALKAPDLVRALKSISAKGLETAKRSRVIIQSVFKYAVNLGLVDADPTTTLKDAIEPPRPTHFPAPTEPRVVGGILRALDSSGLAGPIVHCAMRFHPLVAVRPGELERARWEDFDLEAKEWKFKASKTGQDHVVPLSRQALAILEQVKPFSFGRSEWVFPNARSLNRPMSNGAMRANLIRIGITQDVLVPHGWRAVFRTLGEEQCDFKVAWLEIQLAHSVSDPLGRAYNRTQWLPERRAMMQQWADYLDELKAGEPKGGMR